MRILLTGTTGKMGGYLARHWARQDLLTPGREELDLSRPEALARQLDRLDFDLAVNPAAVATPEGCEQEPELAHRVNAKAPALLARECARRGVPFVHFSTDYVLDGSEPGFKDEHAPCRPNNHYGATKLAGEEAVLSLHPRALVARISWVFGAAGESFLGKIIRQARQGEPLAAVADKYSLPTYAKDLARAIDELLAHGRQGLYHLTHPAEAPVSWHRYAEEVVAALHEEGQLPRLLPVTPLRLSDLPALRSERPIHTAMTPARLLAEGHSLRPWEEAVRAGLREQLPPSPQKGLII
ncbi:SDR family oxidoreductase [Roseibacillus ishigakijimensis]|uniref:dTDP-4-dehydrorhamnose reductase n=1 Tax=Roseibacillus ishigakijimensis TaxID=454146 RepID=A0A934RPT4_9BACT|nr:NAD(P)-dependent oxidoreductase [Roseibacillus ishigakijimensis]MBK1832884.1 NAD(P)-dependent oxidoreductase [Roseibacillus ishigakijimensis]